MTASMQQAVESVRAGDKDKAQELLTEVLAANPDHEQAWLWLAFTMRDDTRHYCLKQVLHINPQNKLVEEALMAPGPQKEAELLTEALKTQTKAIEKPVSAASDSEHVAEAHRDEADAQVVSEIPAPVPARPIDADERRPFEAVQYWLLPGGRELQVLILGEETLSKAISARSNQKEIVGSLDASQIPSELFDSSEEVPYVEILSVTQDKSQISIQYGNGKKRECNLLCKDERMANSVLNAIGRKLPGFERQTEAARSNTRIFGAFLVFILVAIITLVLFMASLELSSSSPALPFDQIQGLVVTLGPIGVLIVGGIVMLIAFIYMVNQYLRPSKKTKLVPDAAVQSSRAGD